MHLRLREGLEQEFSNSVWLSSTGWSLVNLEEVISCSFAVEMHTYKLLATINLN